MRPNVAIDSVKAWAFEIPTDRPEADGTIAWDSTTLVLVEVSGGGEVGIGYTCSSAATAGLICCKLAAAASRPTRTGSCSSSLAAGSPIKAAASSR